MENKVYFVTGIDSNIGKSYATGYLASLWMSEGYKTITQKFIQTGNIGYSEDIDIHRKIMGIGYTIEDKERITMPIILSYPCSPHLAAKIDNYNIDLKQISDATNILINRYERVLIEGAGGLMVPIFENYYILDYIVEKKYPLILVTSGKLGALSQTLLNFEVIKKYNIKLEMVIFNDYNENKNDEFIKEDNFNFIKKYIERDFFITKLLRLPIL